MHGPVSWPELLSPGSARHIRQRFLQTAVQNLALCYQDVILDLWRPILRAKAIRQRSTR